MPSRLASDPDLTPLQGEISTVPETVRHLPMVDAASLAAGTTLLRRIKALRTTLAELFAPHIARAHAAHGALLADRRSLDAPLADAERHLKRTIAAYTLAEEERRALDARRRTADAQAAQAARVWREVEALEAAGYVGDAADLVADFVAAPAVPIVLTPDRVTADGISCREVWRYAIIDDALVPREYLTLDHTKVGGVVRALKGATQILGVRVWAERTIAARATGRERTP